MTPTFLFGGGVNTNCSNMVKDTDFKFQKHIPRSDSETISMTGSANLIQYTRVTDVRTMYGIAVAYMRYSIPVGILLQVKK